MNHTIMIPVPAIVTAHNLLGRMLVAAHRDGEIGREWLLDGVRGLVGQAIAQRRTDAGTARRIGAEVRTAQTIFAAAIADGVVDRREARAIAAALAQPGHTADALADTLSVEGAK